MFWKKNTPAHTYRYVAVLEIEDRTDDKHLHGQRTYRFKLADGTYEEQTFEAAEWRGWQEGVLKGGVVVNP